jgi:hypothetical protein
VSLILEPDPPAEKRPPGYVIKDHLPGDNRQDFAIEVVPALPVLLVDGDTTPQPKRRGSDFLRDALAPARDRTPVVLLRVVPVQEFTPALLTNELLEPEPANKRPSTRPRVLILSNVARLTAAQSEAIEGFLQEGGGVLVTLGERVEPAFYNEQLFRAGKGWLPARVDQIRGDDTQVRTAARPVPGSFFHPALDLFRDVPLGGLGDAWFARWWKTTTPGRDSLATPVAVLNQDHDPFLIEKPVGEGRVLLTAVPLDTSFRTNLLDLPAFVPLAHEMVYYLAGTRAAEHNLRPGQPLRYRLDKTASLEGLRLRPPTGDEKDLIPGAPLDAKVFSASMQKQGQGQLLVHEGMREPGVWRLTTADKQTIHYVVQPDPRESDLTPASEEERSRVAELLPVRYENERDRILPELERSAERQEVWWWFLLGVILLLCGEVWMTRRIVKAR